MLRGLLSSAASSVDHVIASTVIRRNLRASGPARLRADEEWPDLPAITAAYDRPEHYTDPDAFFGAPSIASPRLRRVPNHERSFGLQTSDAIVVDASWSSGEPFHREIAETYLAHASNRTAGARLFLHRTRRATPAAVILVHGYLGGRYAFEERLWPIRRLFERGFDVALATLPFHGVRAGALSHLRAQTRLRLPARARSRPLFPSADPRITNEGVRQTINDLRALLGFFRARGTERVGAMGMSLGGYAVALLATIEPSLAFAVPVIPLADLTEFARGHVPRSRATAQANIARPSRARVHRVISPLARKPLIPSEAVLVIGAAADVIAPIAHAQELAVHFGAQLETFAGGHVLQLGRAKAFRSIERLLVERTES